MNRADRRRAAREAGASKGRISNATLPTTEADIRAMIADAARAKADQTQRVQAARARADQSRTDPDAWAQAWAADGDDRHLNVWAQRLAWDLLDADAPGPVIDRWTAASTNPMLFVRTAIAALTLIKSDVVNVLVDTLEMSTETHQPALNGYESRALFAENAAAAWEDTGGGATP